MADMRNVKFGAGKRARLRDNLCAGVASTASGDGKEIANKLAQH